MPEHRSSDFLLHFFKGWIERERDVLTGEVGQGSPDCFQPVDEVISLQVVAALGYILGQLQ